jgi:hypothetical protein
MRLYANSVLLLLTKILSERVTKFQVCSAPCTGILNELSESYSENHGLRVYVLRGQGILSRPVYVKMKIEPQTTGESQNNNFKQRVTPRLLENQNK